MEVSRQNHLRVISTALHGVARGLGLHADAIPYDARSRIIPWFTENHPGQCDAPETDWIPPKVGAHGA